jgi:hypothetical protein
MRQLPLLHQGNDHFETVCESQTALHPASDNSSTFVKDLKLKEIGHKTI